jgi:hypothetical protein
VETTCRLIAGPALVTATPRPHRQNRRARRQLRAGIPRLHVLGIDIHDRAAGLARHVIAASDGADQGDGPQKNVADFADANGFDLAWLPAPLIPQPAVAGAATSGRSAAP